MADSDVSFDGPQMPVSCDGPMRMLAADVARHAADKKERKAKALRVLADLIETNLQAGSEEEHLLWSLLLEIRQ